MTVFDLVQLFLAFVVIIFFVAKSQDFINTLLLLFKTDLTKEDLTFLSARNVGSLIFLLLVLIVSVAFFVLFISSDAIFSIVTGQSSIIGAIALAVLSIFTACFLLIEVIMHAIISDKYLKLVIASSKKRAIHKNENK